MTMKRFFACLAATLPCVVLAQLTAHRSLARDIYKEMIEIRTVHPDGDNTALARLVAQRLSSAGFDAKDVEVVEMAPRKANLIVRLRNAEIPTYGVSGIFYEFGENRAHGRDERILVKSFYDALDFLDRLVRVLAAGG